MAVRYARKKSTPSFRYAPGDQVIRYVNGRAFFCTVIEVQPDGRVRISCNLWPAGYSAIVTPQEVTLLARSDVHIDT